MRLIDADAVPQEFWKYEFDGKWTGCTIKDLLDSQPTVYSEPEWILCSKRMPEEREWIGTKQFGTTISDEVYVTFEAPDGQRFVDHISFQNGKLSHTDEYRMKVIFNNAKPIAWQPCPEPYKGDSNE